jgi:histidinol-phosphate aminotransferase
LPRYNSGASIESVQSIYGLRSVAKLGSNENRFGMNPNVVAALAQSAAQSGLYPDPDSTELCEIVGSQTGVHADQVIFGNGSEAIIESFCHAAICPEDRVVTICPSFGLHEMFPRAMGATVDKIPMTTDYAIDSNELAEALSRVTKVLIFSNPSNPVGCFLDSASFRRVIEACSSDTLLVIDEAYVEFVDSPQFPDTLEILRSQSRPWLVLRTLSKAYGLAGLRCGYGIASDREIVSLIKRVRSPFSVNRMAQAAAAVALRDREYLHDVVTKTRKCRTSLFDRLKYFAETGAAQIRTVPSQANFLFIDTGRQSTFVSEGLMAEGVIVKPWLEEGFTTGFRVTIGTEEDNERFFDAFCKVIKTVASGRLPEFR